MIQLEAERQNMNQAPLQQGTDLHATPKGRHAIPQVATLVKPGLHGCVGMGAVVICNGQMAQAQCGGLLNQLDGFEASITADGVAMKIEGARTTIRRHLG